jgi:hypothetical protein
MARKIAKRIRRPRGAPEDRPSEYVGFRSPKHVKARLEAAARGTGRSLSTETQFRIEQSFRNDDLLLSVLTAAYGPRSAGLLLMIGRAMHVAGTVAAFSELPTLESSANWIDSPHAFAMARQAVDRILEMVRPAGDAIAPAGISYAGRLGEGIANGLLDALLRNRGGTEDLARWAAPIREAIGDKLAEHMDKRIGDTLPPHDAAVPNRKPEKE